MASDIWLRTILIVRKETRCRHIGYSYRLTARILLYAPSHRQHNTYHGLCYTSRGAVAGTRNSSKGPPHEGSIRRPIAPWANALPLSYVPLLMISIMTNGEINKTVHKWHHSPICFSCWGVVKHSFIPFHFPTNKCTFLARSRKYTHRLHQNIYLSPRICD